MTQDNERKRVVIDYVGPQVDCGRFPVKRAVGETVTVVAHSFADGHDQIRVELLYRKIDQGEWTARGMAYEVNDEWSGAFIVTELGSYLYTVRAWTDRFGTWQSDLQKKFEAGQDVSVELRMGGALLREIGANAETADAQRLTDWADALGSPQSGAVELALGEELAAVARKYPDKPFSTSYHMELAVIVDRPKAVFSTWYGLFPRSFGEAGKHGTFQDCERLLPEIARMGFDV